MVTTGAKVKARDVEEVDHLGFGVCLESAKVLRSIGWPLFGIETMPDGLSFASEDVVHFRKIREAGHKVYVDHALSWEVLHMHGRPLSNADVEQEQMRAAIARARQA